MTATLEMLDPQKISVWQPVSPATIGWIAKRLSPKAGWPEDMPLIVAAKHQDGTYELLDGNHRRAAAIRKKLRSIPVIVMPFEAYDFMDPWGLDLDDMFDVIGVESDLMRENQHLRWMEGNL